MAGSTDIIEWRAIPGFSGYEVSRNGRVRSMDRHVERKTKSGVYSLFCKGREIRPSLSKQRNGRPRALMVRLMNGNIEKRRALHHLVLDAFVGSRPPGYEGCHGDGNCLNNTPENLRWDTRAGNVADAIRHGTFSRPPLHFGEKQHSAKLNAEKVRAIRRDVAAGATQSGLAKMYGVTPATVYAIIKGKTWKHI